ncbi:phosphate ABC transporter substrate-binding protein PstS [Planctomycetota bacterium]
MVQTERSRVSVLSLAVMLPWLVVVFSAAACTEQAESGRTAARKPEFRRTVTVRGAGATFPQPLYSKWGSAYYERTGVWVDYRATGSKSGIDTICAGSTDFGASDLPLSPEELERHGLVQFPVVVGAVAPVVNLPGIDPGALRLTGPILARIYLGEITRWDDPAIRSLNPTLVLPSRDVIPVYRNDVSGTTRLFTQYLCAASPLWDNRVGLGSQVESPAGVGATSNSQVAKFVKQFKHTIGYVDLSHALAMRLTWTSLMNRDGSFVEPSLASTRAALEHGTWEVADPLRPVLANPHGGESWPIAGPTYILVRRVQRSRERAWRLLAFFDWALADGAGEAESLQYVTLPSDYVALIKQTWKSSIGTDGDPLW